MTKPKHRSRTMRRVFRKAPGGRNVLHHLFRKPKAARCAGCGDLLKGVPRERPYKMQNMPKTKKRPERPYGGVLCSRCMRLAIVHKARSENTAKSPA